MRQLLALVARGRRTRRHSRARVRRAARERPLSGVAAVDKLEFTATTDTTEATTQADLFNPSATARRWAAAPREPSCKGTPFGKTVWYDLAPPVDGGVVIRATGFATVVAVYEWGPQSRHGIVDCSANTPAEDLIVTCGQSGATRSRSAAPAASAGR